MNLNIFFTKIFDYLKIRKRPFLFTHLLFISESVHLVEAFCDAALN